MPGNSFGTLFKLTTFGESHGAAIGGIIDGCPAGLKIDFDFVQAELSRRKPGQSHITTQRKEEDTLEFLSGIFEGITTGTPIAFLVRNEDQKPKDYSHLKENYRPSHADFTYDKKYGIRDYRGGGRSSARETIARVVAGAIAKLILKEKNITVESFVKQVGKIKLDKNFNELDLSKTESNIVRCPDEKTAQEMISYIEEIKILGDTVGGVIQCVIKNAPVGLGEPVFDKLHARLGYAMLGINAVKGFELGSGFNSINFKGSEMNDVFLSSSRDDSTGVNLSSSKDDLTKGETNATLRQAQSDKQVKTKTNNSGGIQGGISNGMPVFFNVAFKPVATIMQKQTSINSRGEEITLEGKGRHDPCVLPRAVPIVEAMAALVMVDFLLLSRTDKLF
ncbi:MAG: chorismate synthase [Bacteroidetes bacterium]|nr:chorismate synthase [Bacteroidota bacterium]